jgi:hypothetical protein
MAGGVSPIVGPFSKLPTACEEPPGGAAQVFRMKSDDILATPIDLL